MTPVRVSLLTPVTIRCGSILTLLLLLIGSLCAATPDRIPGRVDPARYRTLAGNVHRLAQPQYDQGEAAPDLAMNTMVLLVKPSAAQQSDLNQLLIDQQDPASPQYHHWLTRISSASASD